MKNKQNCAAKMLTLSHTKGVYLISANIYLESSPDLAKFRIEYKKRKKKHITIFT